MKPASKPKAYFFLKAMHLEGLSPTDRIVFCQLLNLSLMYNSESYDSNGDFTTDFYEGGRVPFSYKVTRETIMEVAGVSYMQYYLSLNKLRRRRYIGSDWVMLIDRLPYFELKVKSGLSGLELIVYSYVAHMQAYYGECDKNHDALAEELGLSYIQLKNTIYNLHKKDKITGIRKGRRVWLRTR